MILLIPNAELAHEGPVPFYRLLLNRRRGVGINHTKRGEANLHQEDNHFSVIRRLLETVKPTQRRGEKGCGRDGSGFGLNTETCARRDGTRPWIVDTHI